MAAQHKAVKPSSTIAPKNTGLASFSVCIHLATIGDWDAWKPEIAPHAIVTNKYGNIDFSVKYSPCVVNSGMVYAGFNINAPVIKIAMIKVDKKLKENNLESKMVLQIHDELIFKVKKDEKDFVFNIVKNEMEHALDIGIDLEVDGGFGVDWYSAK